MAYWQYGSNKKRDFCLSSTKGLEEGEGVERKTPFKGRKEVLIKSVGQAVSTYAMSYFKIPDCVCDEINSLISCFWWSNNGRSKGMKWVSWSKLCTPKIEGGLEFRDLKAFNLMELDICTLRPVRLLFAC